MGVYICKPRHRYACLCPRRSCASQRCGQFCNPGNDEDQRLYGTPDSMRCDRLTEFCVSALLALSPVNAGRGMDSGANVRGCRSVVFPLAVARRSTGAGVRGRRRVGKRLPRPSPGQALRRRRRCYATLRRNNRFRMKLDLVRIRPENRQRSLSTWHVDLLIFVLT